MTMIAGYRLKQGGFLQADILLTSAKGSSMVPSQIPSLSPTANATALKDHVAVGLCQKILLVSDRFAIAFAGSVSAIRAAVRVLDALLAKNPDLTGSQFFDAILADEPLKKSKLSAIALAVEDGEIQITNYRAEFGICNEHFELHMGGSGAEHAIRHYEHYDPQIFDVLADDIVVQGTCMALHEFAGHLVDEFDNGFESESVADLFGGGYEVVAYHSGRFHKISDVVYAYAEATIDTNGILQVDVPKFLLKSTYEGDDLKIRSLEVRYDEAEGYHRTRNDRTFTIAPIMRYQESHVEENCGDVNFLGEFLCFVIGVNSQSGSFAIPFIKKYDRELGFATKAFLAFESEGYLYLNYSDIFQGELEAHVLTALGQERP